MTLKQKIVLSISFLLMAVCFVGIATAQAPSGTLTFLPQPQFVDNTAIAGNITYIVFKRTGTTTVEVDRSTTNQHSTVTRSVAAVAGDCFFVVAEVAGVRSVNSPEACLGKTPKGVTSVTIKVTTP